MDWIASLRLELTTSLAFLTRLPIRLDQPLPLAEAVRGFPLAGTLIGAIAAIVLTLAHWVGIPALPAALLAVGAAIMATGALHEDGLADSADGLFSGASRERVLEIMRDSRIGTFGALALILSVGLRASALSVLVEGAAALIAVHALSRAWLPWLMRNGSLARSDGLAASAGRPEGDDVLWAAGFGVVIAMIGIGIGPALLAAAVSVACALGVAALARWRLGGYTGDTLGAAQQAAEIGALLALTTLL
ncbi:MAG: adenosylcobinamide-GDP ribazoletransferase [Alphaproteobacteria bacterium]|nr:adenosylcobinamide-GDP ribazoletransferase [Alphaproteobacteria bacterium]